MGFGLEKMESAIHAVVMAIVKHIIYVQIQKTLVYTIKFNHKRI